jgi:hypothetical protein
MNKIASITLNDSKVTDQQSKQEQMPSNRKAKTDFT